jgi:hypothetical protein
MKKESSTGVQQINDSIKSKKKRFADINAIYLSAKRCGLLFLSPNATKRFAAPFSYPKQKRISK